MRYWTLLALGVIVVMGCGRSAPTGPPLAVTPLSPRPEPAAEHPAATLFVELPAERTGIDFQPQLYDPLKQIRVLMFITANGGICTGDYDNDGLSDFYVTSPVGGNRLYRNVGGLHFQDVTRDAGLLREDFWGTGATFVDIDNDGDLDIYACGYTAPNQLWINDRGAFSERAHEYGLDFNGASMTMAFADMDNDGDLDGYLATTAKAPPRGATFRVRYEGDKPVVLESLREYWDLIYLPGKKVQRTEAGQYDHLFRNDQGQFHDVTKGSGIDGPYFTLSATWWDYDQDGFPDIYVSNDFTGPDKLYHNNGNGTFTDVIRDALPRTPWFSMGSDAGDLNNDGLVDFFASDMSATNHYRDKVMMGNMQDTGWFLDFAEPRQYMRNAVFVNTGTGHMYEMAFQTGLSSTDWTWNPRLADFDNDGRLDVFATNGILRDGMNSDLSQMASRTYTDGSPQWAKFWANQPMHKEANVAYRNLGDYRFENVSQAWGLDRVGVSFGAATADFDNDGDLDLVVNNADAKLSFYENQSRTGHRLYVKLQGTQSNRSGVGATIRLEAGGVTQVRYVTLARGWLSSCEAPQHFGLGDVTTVDRLTVTWPSGIRQEFTQIAADQRCTITETAGEEPAVLRPRPVGTQVASSALFLESREFSGARHQENEFDDFALQPLLPNRQSQQGPALAVADVDGDGDEDVYLGGASGSPGQLLRHQGAALAAEVPPAFAKDATAEDVDAVFFDCDQDGDQDLYVVSGSNEWPADAQQYRDRLYVNDGRGQWTRAEQALPDLRDSGGCVAAGDVDRDGDLDLFVGGRAKPGDYPLAATSRLLVNEGGRFVEATPASFQTLGIVTDAIWSDVNGDQTLDLMITTEWGPVRCLLNENGQLTERTAELKLADQLGWWNALDAADIDGDGDLDYLATNFGDNTKYHATPERPELLYYGDLDGSGKANLVEAKIDGNRSVPRRGFSCSRSAMPFLNDKLKSFHNFASASLTELYTDERLARCQKFTANRLESGVFVNRQADGFEFRPLPSLAQIAPSMGGLFVDADQDGHMDIILAQNFNAAQRETGRMNGGLSLLLRGDGGGTFAPVWPRDSGIVLPGDTRRVLARDLNRDGHPDLIFAVNNGPVKVFLRRAGGR